jgi:hypothetical protein
MKASDIGAGIQLAQPAVRHIHDVRVDDRKVSVCPNESSERRWHLGAPREREDHAGDGIRVGVGTPLQLCVETGGAGRLKRILGWNTSGRKAADNTTHPSENEQEESSVHAAPVEQAAPPLTKMSKGRSPGSLCGQRSRRARSPLRMLFPATIAGLAETM